MPLSCFQGFSFFKYRQRNHCQLLLHFDGGILCSNCHVPQPIERQNEVRDPSLTTTKISIFICIKFDFNIIYEAKGILQKHETIFGMR